jgi:hypothetical protein
MFPAISPSYWRRLFKLETFSSASAQKVDGKMDGKMDGYMIILSSSVVNQYQKAD